MTYSQLLGVIVLRHRASRIMELARAYRIETERLVIRCYEPSDAPKIQEAITESLDHLLPWMPWAKNEPESLDAKINRLRLFRGQFDLGQDYVFGIFNKSETELIGSTGLHTDVGKHAREIGYWINLKFIGQGFATEAVNALTKVGFEVEQLTRIEIRCAPDNVRSQSIPRKLGYKLEATLKNRIEDISGNFRDVMIWTMFKSDYERSPIQNVELKAFDIMGRPILIDERETTTPNTNHQNRE
jgi:RimJ/RimL family protein N-acetyltransferase